MEHEIHATGPKEDLNTAASSLGRNVGSITQISNENVSSVGLTEVRRGCVGFLYHLLHNSEDTDVVECNCSITDDHQPLREQRYHETSCPVLKIIDLVSATEMDKTPLLVEISTSKNNLLKLRVSDTFQHLDESRIIHEQDSPYNDLVAKEISYAFGSFRSQFPSPTLTRDWLWAGHTLTFCIDPIIDHTDESHKNRIHISIRNELPKMPRLVKTYQKFTLESIPTRPFTFDLREHLLPELDQFEETALEKSQYSTDQ